MPATVSTTKVLKAPLIIIKDIYLHLGEWKIPTAFKITIPWNENFKKIMKKLFTILYSLWLQKTLSMHHTMMMNRRINVMYTRPDKNFDKKEIQVNFYFYFIVHLFWCNIISQLSFCTAIFVILVVQRHSPNRGCYLEMYSMELIM